MNLNASKRILSTMNNILELPRFRYLDDAGRFLCHLENETNKLERTLNTRTKQLDFLTKISEDDLAFFLKKYFKPLKVSIEPIINNINQVTKNYLLIENLYHIHRLLQSMEVQISMQFPARGGDTYKNIINGLTLLKEKICNILICHLNFLQRIGKLYTPYQIRSFSNNLVYNLEKLDLENLQTFYYILTSNDQLVFTCCHLIKNLQYRKKVIPYLYITTRWQTNKPCLYITPEFELPNNLKQESGLPVKSLENLLFYLKKILKEGY
jgi:hypothetical protein